MASKNISIINKKSSVPGKIPAAADLELGELAINIHDGDVYIKKSDDSVIKVGDDEFALHGRGHPDLTLTHNDDIVLRKSDFICPRTLSVKCDKASDLVPREMVSNLQNPKTKGLFIITVD